MRGYFGFSKALLASTRNYSSGCKNYNLFPSETLLHGLEEDSYEPLPSSRQAHVAMTSPSAPGRPLAAAENSNLKVVIEGHEDSSFGELRMQDLATSPTAPSHHHAALMPRVSVTEDTLRGSSHFPRRSYVMPAMSEPSRVPPSRSVKSAEEKKVNSGKRRRRRRYDQSRSGSFVRKVADFASLNSKGWKGPSSRTRIQPAGATATGGHSVPLVELDSAHNLATWLLLRRVLSTLGLRFLVRAQHVLAKVLAIAFTILVFITIELVASESVIAFSEESKLTLTCAGIAILCLGITAILYAAKDNAQFVEQIAMLNDEEAKLKQILFLEQRMQGDASRGKLDSYREAIAMVGPIKSAVKLDSKLHPVRILGLRASGMIFRTVLVTLLPIVSFLWRFLRPF